MVHFVLWFWIKVRNYIDQWETSELILIAIYFKFVPSSVCYLGCFIGVNVNLLSRAERITMSLMSRCLGYNSRIFIEGLNCCTKSLPLSIQSTQHEVFSSKVFYWDRNKYSVEGIKISVEVYKLYYWHLPCFLSISMIYYSGGLWF